MPCQISDTFVDVNGNSVVNLTVVAYPATLGFFESFSGTFKEVTANLSQGGELITTTSNTGSWSLTLPFPSLSSATPWKIRLPDGTVWTGIVPEGQAGPFTLLTMKNTYGWTAGTS